jgi:hypothetical protein
MRDAQTTSWRRFSDRACNDADHVRNGCTGSSNEKETRQLEAWEDEGRSAASGLRGRRRPDPQSLFCSGRGGSLWPSPAPLPHTATLLPGRLGSRRRAQEQSREGGGGSLAWYRTRA